MTRDGHRHLHDSIEGDIEETAPPVELTDRGEIPSRSVERLELRKALHKALMSLAPKYRTAMLLRDFQQKSIAETARLLEITGGCVKSRLNRARTQMRKTMASWRANPIVASW